MTRAEPLADTLREFPCLLVVSGPRRAAHVLAREGGGTVLFWFEAIQPSSIS
jgi:hypothetical protein